GRCGGGVAAGLSHTATDRVLPSGIPARERLVHQHRPRIGGPVSVVEVTSRDERDVECLEEPRTDRRGPEVPREHGIAAGCHFDLRAHDRRPHARQAIREGDAAYVWLVLKPPLEL